MSDEAKCFDVGEEWRGCWQCLQTLAKCTHLKRFKGGTWLTVTSVDYDAGVITVDGGDE